MPPESARAQHEPHDHAHQHPPAEHSHGAEQHDADFDGQWWENHYREHDEPGVGSIGTPTPYVTWLGDAASQDAARSTVLDAGCGTGADALWLAQHGCDVTAVDISPTAIELARAASGRAEPQLAQSIDWIVADVMTWDPPRKYDAVISQYVHPDASYEQFVERLAAAVAPGGRLVLVGHEHGDHHSREHAPRDVALTAPTLTRALNRPGWTVETAQTLRRTVTHAGAELALVDTLVVARRS